MLPYAFDLLMYSIYSAAYVITGLAIVHSVNIILCYSSIYLTYQLLVIGTLRQWPIFGYSYFLRIEVLSPGEFLVRELPIYIVDVYVTSECILICILYIVTRCLFRDVSIMHLSHVVMPRCSDRED